MNPEQWRRVDRIFNEALDREPGERMRFVEEACAGDVALRKEVETLIIAQVQAGSFMETPSVRIGAGTRFGPYEVRSPIGAGGMGEVYRAHDTKLKRDVALKVLPELFASDADRLARFKREAQMLASLNHPNIGAIYGLEEAEGRMALVLELVEGPTLAERIAQGPISIEQALPIARQIAEALEAAHERGIIHRDLKPANIKITSGGKVKVLDFGLARMRDSAGLNADPANSPTAMTETLPGMIIGTAAYMAPEQAKGTDADRTSDIWAFGCVLYEMLTGRRAFDGETVTDILGSVLKVDPDWSALPKTTPTVIRRLLGRCLQKDRKHRLHDIIDVRILIEDVGAEPELAGPNAAPAAPRRREVLRWLVAGGAVVAAGDVLERLYFRNPPAGPEESSQIITPPAPPGLDAFAVSPDGRKLVFVAASDGQQRLYLQSLSSSEAEPLPGTEGAFRPFWKPDSQSIGFGAGRLLKRIDVVSRELKQVTNTEVLYGASWNEEGVIVFAGNVNAPLSRVSENGGQPVPVTHLDLPRQSAHRSPKFLPDGQHFLLYVLGNSEGRGVYLGSLQSPAVGKLFDADGPAVFVSPGYLLFIRRGALIAQRYDPHKLEPAGEPVTVVSQAGFVSASANVIAYRTQAPSILTWFDRSGNPAGTIGKEDGAAPKISSDGNRVAMYRSDADGNSDVWVLDVNGGAHTHLTNDPGVDANPIWSQDSKRIVFSSNRGHPGVQDLYTRSADGSGEDALLWADSGRAVLRALDWPPNGKFLLFSKGRSPTRDLYVLPLSGDGKPAGEPRALANSSYDEPLAQFSPNGHWIAYQSNQSNKNEIYVQPFPGPKTKTPISVGGGTQPRWTGKTNELFYVGLDGKLIAVPVTPSADGRTLDTGTPAVIAPNLRVLAEYDVSANGQRILMSATTDDQQTPPIKLIRNWKPPWK